MSFQRSADSWKSKAHMSGVRLPVLVGVTAVAVCLAVAVGVGLVGIATSDGLTISASQEDSGSADASADGEDAQDGEEAGDAAATSDTVFVFVSGAVASPGVFELASDARVQDAISAAGGFSDDAATDALNLARAVEDGEQIDVPTLEEQEAAEAAGTTVSTSGSDSTSGTSELININTATAEELETLPGIGEVTAAKIIADREANGAYATIEDITRVSGIGDAKFAAIEDLICVG